MPRKPIKEVLRATPGELGAYAWWDLALGAAVPVLLAVLLVSGATGGFGYADVTRNGELFLVSVSVLLPTLRDSLHAAGEARGLIRDAPDESRRTVARDKNVGWLNSVSGVSGIMLFVAVVLWANSLNPESKWGEWVPIYLGLIYLSLAALIGLTTVALTR